MTDELDRLAGVLDDAARSATPVEQLTRSMRLSLDDAYEVQQRLVARQVMLGDWVVGVKLGFTSPAKAAQMGVADVIIGQLTERMRIPEGGAAYASTVSSIPARSPRWPSGSVLMSIH